MISEWLNRREYAALLSLLDTVENPTPEENAIAEKIRGIVARMRHRGKRGGRRERARVEGMGDKLSGPWFGGN